MTRPPLRETGHVPPLKRESAHGVALYGCPRHADDGAVEVVVLGWDPDRGAHWVPPVGQVMAQLASTGSATCPWSLGPEAIAPRPGSVVHLMLQGRVRGLVGRGVVRSSPYLAVDPLRPGTMSTYVLVEWDRLRPEDERIPLKVLEAKVPDLPWGGTYAPMTSVPESLAEDLDALWDRPLVPAGASGLSSPLELIGGLVHALLHATPLTRR